MPYAEHAHVAFIVNTGSGAGMVLPKDGVTVQFRSLIPGSSKIAFGVGSSEVSIDLTEANVNLANLGGSLPWGKLSSVPSTFAPATHTHTLSQISDAGAFGKTLAATSTKAAALTALGITTTTILGITVLVPVS